MTNNIRILKYDIKNTGNDRSGRESKLLLFTINNKNIYFLILYTLVVDSSSIIKRPER